ncbi:MAG: YqaJ viral recombinase family protein [Pseudomonadales bacterium]
MIIHDVEQGSEEWLALRKQYLPASLAPSMMGEGYNKRSDAMSEYLGYTTKEITPYLQKLFDEGHAVEEEIRPVVAGEYLESFAPQVGSKEIEGLPLLASFDGITGDGRIVWECKSTNKQFEEIPPLYYWQLEHQLIVSGAEKAILTVVNRDTGQHRNYEYYSLDDRRKLLLSGWHQWQEDCRTFEPPVVDMSESQEWQNAVNSYIKAKQELDTAKQIEDAAKKALIDISEQKSTKGCGLSLTKIDRKGAIDYSKIEALKGMDLEPYRKKSSTSFRITLDNEDK